jgi:transposase
MMVEIHSCTSSFRGLKFTTEVDELIQALLWCLVRLHPHYHVHGYTNALSNITSIHFKRNFALQIFKNWHWSWKKPAMQHVQTYTRENITYCTHWVVLIPHIPFTQLKFYDESHFVSRQLHHDLTISPIGVRPYLHDAANLAESFLLTLLLDLSNKAIPFFIYLHTGSNTEFNFLTFIRAAVAAGWLQDRDFLIVDNATVHFSEGSRDELLRLLMDNSIQYLFLPTYSPELNLCELVFSFIKKHIRSTRSAELQVPLLVTQALSLLPYNRVVKFYEHCVNIQARVPA